MHKKKNNSMCVFVCTERTWQMKVELMRKTMADNPYGPTALLLSALDENACESPRRAKFHQFLINTSEVQFPKNISNCFYSIGASEERVIPSNTPFTGKHFQNGGINHLRSSSYKLEDPRDKLETTRTVFSLHCSPNTYKKKHKIKCLPNKKKRDEHFKIRTDVQSNILDHQVLKV